MPLAKITVDEHYSVPGTGDAVYPGPLSDEEKAHGYLTASNVANRLIMHEGWDWDLGLSYCRLYWRHNTKSDKPLPCLQLKFKPRSGITEKIQELEVRIETGSTESQMKRNLLVTWFIGQISYEIVEECKHLTSFWVKQAAKGPIGISSRTF